MLLAAPHNPQGYPGTLHVSVTYSLSKTSNELTATITATTDEATPGGCVPAGGRAEPVSCHAPSHRSTPVPDRYLPGAPPPTDPAPPRAPLHGFLNIRITTMCYDDTYSFCLTVSNVAEHTLTLSS